MPSLSLRTSALITAALTGLLVIGVASPALAATTESSLAADLSATGTRTIVLENDLTVTASTLFVGGVATLDLHGFTLTANNISLSIGSSLRIIDVGGGGRLIASGAGFSLPGIATNQATLIIDGGTVTATGGANQAGIGGGGSNGTIIINGGTVTATGGVNGAGIGGSYTTSGSNITVNGGTVVAQGGSDGAGIGGGGPGGGGTGDAYDLFIHGGTVTATGGTRAAGIGGGYQRTLSRLLIDGGTVTATGGQDAAGIGSGASTGNPSVDLTFGATAVITATPGARTIMIGLGPSAVGNGSDGGPSGFDLAGTLIANTRLIVHVTTSIASTGILDGNAPLTSSGTGIIVNNGAIRLTNVADSVDTVGGAVITGNTYLVTFDTNAADAVPATISPIRVYATSFTLGNRTLPTPTRAGWVFAGWQTAGGTAVTSTSTLSANATVFAQWNVPAALPATGVNPTGPMLAGIASLLLGIALLARRRFVL
jgi:uncharacterized repeat protein (TIGR02543 family)/LPXTG-motif cell wall-anchored protein